MDIIKLNDKIEEFIQKHGEELSKSAATFKKDLAIDKSSDWQKVLDELKKEGRVLRIGIVGRVKAGKSSMLNALLFDGQDVLPKAATPMTAALTIMKHSETISAEVDFFTHEDIEEIRERHQDYQNTFEELKQKAYNEFEERALNKQKRSAMPMLNPLAIMSGSSLSRSEQKECEEKAIRQAQREIRENPNSASYDHYERILKSKKKLSDLEKYSLIEAHSIDALINGELNQFVGADGPYMPFTKSVTLHIPHPGLEGLEIIDTPGINDPVSSRGERTEQLLKFCNVILVVSPSGQFLSGEDTDLLERITTKDGKQWAYLIASQVDNQLYGSAKAGLKDPVEVLQRVSTSLTEHARGVLNKLSSEHPEMRVAAEILLKHDVICSSSVAYTMSRYFDNQNSWDENIKHVYKNLQNHFPEAFVSKKLSLHVLEKLANIENIQRVLDEVKEKKTEILEKERVDFVNAKQNALKLYIEKLDKEISADIKQIEKGDIEKLSKQKKELDKKQETVLIQIKEMYEDQIVEASLSLHDQMKNTLDKEKRAYEAAERDSQGSETKSEEVYVGRGGFLWLKKKYETRYYEVKTVNTTPIRQAILELQQEMTDSLEKISKQFQIKWRKSLFGDTVSKLREIMGDENLDTNLIRRVIRNAIATVPEVTLNTNRPLPQELRRSGTLSGSTADAFIGAANNFFNDLVRTLNDEIKSFSREFERKLKSNPLAEDLTKNIEDELATLMDAIENRELSLERYTRIKDELNKFKEDASR